LWDSGAVEGTTWAALTAALTVAGAIWTWIAFRRRGAAGGLRALGFTLLPAAAWLTGTLEMVVEIAGSVTDWATGLVFDIFTWAGVGLAGLAVVLLIVSGIIRDRQLARAQSTGSPGAAEEPTSRGALPPSAGPRKGRSPIDDEMADIEAMLKKRGIE
jgi:hypothetical protein